MLFNKDDNIANERTIYETRPNMLLGCKKVIYALILLIVILNFASLIISFVGNMQVYLISYVRVALTRYVTIAIFVVILFIIIYMIYQLLSWYSTEYILTNQRIITKKGLLYTRKNYMPYSTIQDINSSQSIIGKILSVGNITVFSAYDNNQIELKNVPHPEEIENILFSQMNIFNNRFGGFPNRDYGYSQNEYAYNNRGYPNQDNEIYNESYGEYPPIDDEEFYYEDEPYYNEEPIYNETHQPNYQDNPKEYSYSNPYLEEDKDHYFEDDNLESNINNVIYGSNMEFKPNEKEIRYNRFNQEDSTYYKENTYSKQEEPHVLKEKESQKSVVERHFNKFKK